MNKCILLIVFVALVACRKNERIPKTAYALPDSVYIHTGNEIAGQTFDTLRQSLLSAIAEGGIPFAIDFCSERAIALTETYADTVAVRRTSLRFRNRVNQPDQHATGILKGWDEQIRQSGSAEPRLMRIDELGEIRYYKPIFAQAMCLNCHGNTGTNIQPATMEKIRDKYPDDLATDYREGDLRGAWEVIFKIPASSQ